MLANEVVKALALEHERDFVDAVIHVFFFDDSFVRDVAEGATFLA